jgi:alpha-glucosidase (family GH31 glycosyl hydrolase)
VAAVAFAALFCAPAGAQVQRKKFTTSSAYLVVEVLDDDLVHFELAAGSGPPAAQPIYTSPMVLRTDYPGPSSFSAGSNQLETAALRIEVDPASLAVTVRDKAHANAVLTLIRPAQLNIAFKQLEIEQGAMQNVYGLGQQFIKEGVADGDWKAHGVRRSGPFGNTFEGFQNAAVGNVQIPVMYAVGAGNLNYALFLDNVHRQRWDFSGTTWQVGSFGDQVRFYVMAGPDLPDLRRDYLELTGTPPVPPRKAFGLWVSEFGYDNWDQIENLRAGLRQESFPVDGFVLDLNWFGGVVLNDDSKSRMGRLNWDESQSDGNPYFFPAPGQQIQHLAADHLGLAVIEESYLATPTDTFNQMPKPLTVFQEAAGQCDPNHQDDPVVNLHGFWGTGRMIDWSDPKAGTFIHDQRRFPNLVKKGVSVHWTDLGEPETFDGAGCYDGVETVAGVRKNRHADVHNLYNLLWNASIWQGYFQHQGQKNDLGQTNQRPFLLTRSGAAGTQRYGAAMWSGDIASNLGSLAAHMNAQLHMSFSGIDYYGADCGGFRREVMPENDKNGSYRGYEAELYTQWFANASWFDVPVRPHTDNEFVSVQPPYATAPHLVGKKADNLANLRQRYELIPYYYSLAYRAQLAGEPLEPPLVFYYQNDANVRAVGHEKLIGRDVLVGVVANHGEYERNVYLPAGDWVNYHSNEWVHSTGQFVANVPAYRNGQFRLPVFVRAGALLPQMFVDDATLDASGSRKAGAAPHEELIVRAYAATGASSFTLYEDDGQTLRYDAAARPRYRYRTTSLTQQTAAGVVRVRIAPAQQVGGTGTIPGLVSNRSNVVRLVVDNARAQGVKLNGTALVEQTSAAAFESATSGWRNAGPNLIEAKSGALGTGANKVFEFALQAVSSATSVNFVCQNGFTQPGESIYVAGSLPALGNFDPAQAIRLAPNVYYEYIYHPPPGNHGPGPKAPVWTGIVSQLPPGATFQWKCLRRRDNGTGQPQWETGPNHAFTTAASGYAGRSLGRL